MTGLLITGGVVVDGSGAEPVAADVLVDGERIRAVTAPGASFAERDDLEVLDAGGRLVVPGFVDAHSHAEGAVFDRDVQLALLRQGVTSVIGGQDGISFAPGDGRHASRYFAAINGPHPRYRGGGVAGLLASYDGAIPIRPGAIADIAVVDPERVRDASTYDEPLRLAEGIDDVVVSGRTVLRHGELTGATPGGGLRHAAAAAA